MEKGKLSIGDYLKRKENGEKSGNSKTTLDPRLKTVKKLSNVKPLELKLVKWAPRINAPHLTQYISPSPVLQRRNSEPAKSSSTKDSYQPFNLLKRKNQEQSSFPSSSDILAKSRDSVKSASYVVTSGKIHSDSLKRHFVSNGGNLVPLPYKRSRWSIESMDSTEPVASETENSKSNLDDNQLSLSRSSCTDEATAFAKSSKRHSKELVNPNPKIDGVKGFTKKNPLFTNPSDQPGPSGKNLANSSCTQLSKEKYPFSEQLQSVDTRSNVFKSTSNVSSAVTSSPKRKLIITPDARLIIEKEYKNSSPKRKDPQKDVLPNANFFRKNKYRCSSPKRNTFPLPNASLFKKRKLEYQSKLYQKSTNKKNFKANLSSMVKDKELGFKAVQKKDSIALIVDKTPEKRKYVKSSSEPSQGTNNLSSSTAFSPKDIISPNKSLIKEQKHESSSKPFQNLFDKRTMEAKLMRKNEDLPIINENTPEKRKLVKSSISVSSKAGNYLSLSNAWSQKRNSGITSEASFIKKRKSDCNSKPLQMSMDQKNTESKVKKKEFSFESKQNADNLATSEEKIVEKSKPVNLQNSKPLQKSMDQKSQESKVKQSELSFKSKQNADNLATIEERIVEKSKPVKSSTDAITNYLALRNAWSQRNGSIKSNASLNKKKKSECNLNQKSIDPESKSNQAKPTQKTDEVVATTGIVKKRKPVKFSTDPIANYLELHNAWSQKRNISVTSNASPNKKRKSEYNSKPFQEPVDHKNLVSKLSGVLKKSELGFKPTPKTENVTIINDKSVEQRTCDTPGTLAIINKRTVEKITSDTQKTVEKITSDTQKTVEKITSDTQKTVEKITSDTQKTVEKITSDTKKTVEKRTSDTQKIIEKRTSDTQKTVEKITSDTQKTVEKITSDTQKTVEKRTSDTQKTVEKRTSDTQKTVEKRTSDTQKTVEKLTSDTQKTVEKRTSDTQKIIEKRASVKSRTETSKGTNEVLNYIKTANLDIIGKETAKRRTSNQSSSVSFQKTNESANCNALPVELKSGKTSNSVSPLITSNSPVNKNCSPVEQLDCSVSAENCDKKCSGKSGKAYELCPNDCQLKSLQDSTKENIKSPMIFKSQSQVLTKRTHKVKSKKKRKSYLHSSKSKFEVLKKISKFRRIYKIGSKYKRNKVNIKKKHLKNSMNIVQTLDHTVKPKSRRQSMESVIEINEEDSKDIQSPEIWNNGVESVMITNVRHFPESNFQLMSDCEKSLILRERSDIIAPVACTNDYKVSEISVAITDVRHLPESNFQLMSDYEESHSIQEKSGIISPFDGTNDSKVSGNSCVVITDVRHIPESNFQQMMSDGEESLNIQEESNVGSPSDCTNDYQWSEESDVVITDVRHCPENKFQHFISDCEGILSIEQKEEILLNSPLACTNNYKVSEKSQCVPSTTLSIRNEDTRSSEFNTDFENYQAGECYKGRKNVAKNLVLSYKKYKNGKMAILMFDFKNQTCKRIPLTNLFAKKTVLSTGLPVEVLKKSLYGPSILNALSIECCVGFILSEIFLYKAGADDKCSAITRHCVVFSILRHLKTHSQCEVHNLLFKFVKGSSKEFKLKTSWIHLQKLSEILLKGIVKSRHCKSHKKKSKSSYCDSEPCFFKCSNVPFIDRFFDSFNRAKYTDTFIRTSLSSKKLFCASCLLDYEFCREYLTGVISGRLLENGSIGLGHNPCICAQYISNLRIIYKDSFCASLKKKGISFNVLKKCENLIDLRNACFLETKWVSNVLNCLPYIRSLEDMPFSLFYNVFISHQGFHETPKEPFSFVCEEQKSAFRFIFPQTNFVKKGIGTYCEDSTNIDCINLNVDPSNYCDQKYLLAINSLKHTSVDLFTYVYESVFKPITSQKSMLTLFPPGSNTPEPPLKVSSSHVNEITCISYEPEPSLDPTEGAKEVNEKVLPEIPQHYDVDTSVAIKSVIKSLKSPCIGDLIFFHNRNLTLHCTKDYDDLFLPLDLFKKDSVMGRYYDHLRKTGPHEIGFNLVNLCSMSKENMESYNFLRNQLNYQKSVLQGLICIASEPGKETSHDIVKRITEQLETIAGYEVACRALLL